MDEAEFIYVPVPAPMVPDVYALLVELGAAQKPEGDPPKTEPPPLGPELVQTMYRESQEQHRKLMRFLADHPDRWHSTSDLAEALNLQNKARGMAGMLGAFGRRANHRYGGRTPWTTEWDYEHNQARHMVNFDVARYIHQAAEADEVTPD